jgi:hypothetical protein
MSSAAYLHIGVEFPPWNNVAHCDAISIRHRSDDFEVTISYPCNGIYSRETSGFMFADHVSILRYQLASMDFGFELEAMLLSFSST